MPLYVWTDIFGAPILVGATDAVDEAGEFRYAPSYIEAGWPAIDPINLRTDVAVASTAANKGVFGVLHDAGPDAWGRRVLTSMHPGRMANASQLDILSMTEGHGIGALLFSRSRDGVKPRARSLPLTNIGAFAAAQSDIEMGVVVREQLRQVMESATSLGGMHPKVAAVDSDGVQWIAKFKGKEDAIDTPRVECASMQLARACGIDVADVRQSAIGERAVAMVRRFDRTPGGRCLHYASAHALWNRATAGEADAVGWMSYAGILDLARELPGVNVRQTANELFRRMTFNVIIGNTDDHGRNHGFLMDVEGNWRLSPAFDVEPTIGGQVQALGVGPNGRERSIQNVLAGAAQFGLNQVQGRHVIEEILAVTSKRFETLLRQVNASDADVAQVLQRILVPSGKGSPGRPPHKRSSPQ